MNVAAPRSASLMNTAALLCTLVAAALLLASAARWLAKRPVFDFKRIEVRSAVANDGAPDANAELRHVTAASLRAALAGRLRGNYFTMPLDDVRRQFESVPWVAQASVRRIWPNRLQVTLREHRALGAWADGRLLSEAGVLFVANVAEAEIYGPLPEFSGPDDAASAVAVRYRDFVAQLAPLALTVDTVEVSDRRSWAVIASAGDEATRLELGRDDTPDSVPRRMTDVVAAVPLMMVRTGGMPERIDARYTNGIAATSARKPPIQRAPSSPTR